MVRMSRLKQQLQLQRRQQDSTGHAALLALYTLMCALLGVIGWIVYDAASHPYRTSTTTASGAGTCPYQTLDQLTPQERFPHQGPRHQVEPPQGGKISLVCCQTTKGPWNIAVHDRWAPRGAQRFLDMVRQGYFNKNKVPLMRCIRNFLCQFGLAGPASQAFDSRLPDDPNWLPKGPAHQTNAQGVKRFAQGYLAYAGSGVDSRGVQLIVALQDNPRLGGGSPWEVPWGELVGQHSWTTLEKIYTGYGEKGPSQGLLRQKGFLEKVAQEFPLLDYITSCQVVDEAIDDWM